MSYTAQTPILGSGRTSADAIQAWFAERGRLLAPQYAPDKTYQAPPAGLGRAIVDQCRRYETHPVNHDLAAAQILHETAAWQSRYARERNNPGGIGAVNDNPDTAYSFPSVAAGVRAHVAHLLVYAVGDGPWSVDTPRRDAVAAKGWLGVARTWGDLNGRWAWPGTTYGQTIATLANALLAFAGATGLEPGVIPKPPMRTDRQSRKFGHDYAKNGGRVIEAIVDHIGQGSSESNLNYLTTGPVSCNYFIHEDGTIFEVVPPQHSAWTNGDVNQPDRSNPLIRKWVDNGWNPNVRTITVEHGGWSTRGRGGALTPAQWASTIWLHAWLCQEHRLPPTRERIIGHHQINSVDRPYCPGFNDAEWERLIVSVANYGGRNLAAVSRLMMPPLNPAPIDGKIWPYVFHDYYRKHGGLAVFGHVRTGVFIERDDPTQPAGPDNPDKLVAYTQRYRFEYQPAVAGQVEGGLLGNEVLAMRYKDGPPA
jgi:N-acetyl-anhydromuramyl-L-alanine amidase AmpD